MVYITKKKWIGFEKKIQLRVGCFYTVWNNNGPSPWSQVYVICIIHTITDCSITNALFTSFKLFQQPKTSRYCKRITEHGIISYDGINTKAPKILVKITESNGHLEQTMQHFYPNIFHARSDILKSSYNKLTKKVKHNVCWTL